MTDLSYRLPTDVLPQAYIIHVDASPKRSTFSGVVRIDAKATEAVDVIELNARDLKITDHDVIQRGRSKECSMHMHPERQTISLQFDKPLSKGKIAIELSYSGQLNANMHGLYLATDGQEQAIVSQCEATDARAIFPCFDEPMFKASLEWIVTTDKEFDVITNGARLSARSKGQQKTWTFEPTKKISTYLAAISIGQFDASPTFQVANKPCRIVGGKGSKSQMRFAKAVTTQVIPWYEKYFGTKYPFSKLDQVAVPGFDAGAMENVGAIFYRQSLLLMDEKATSWNSKKRIAEVVAHEIAHQWFGNLVTMQWWDDLWLNEAFATWVSFKACDKWQPTWRMWDDFQNSKESALKADALQNTHPIYTPVESPAEATELFDVITYEKGCAVLRMVESFLGEDIFQKGIAAYIKEFKGANAVGHDLWTALKRASKKPVDKLMQSWVSQSGFPLISVSTSHKQGKTTVTLKQKRFFADPKASKTKRQTWPIPMVIAYASKNGIKHKKFFLDKSQDKVTLPQALPNTWVYANAAGTGFFRLNMNKTTLKHLLHDGLSHLGSAEKVTLINDQWALVLSGHNKIDNFLEVVSALRDDTDHLVCGTIASRLSYIDNYLVQKAQKKKFQRWIRDYYEPTLKTLGWQAKNNDNEEITVRRATVVQMLGSVGRHVDVLEQAGELLKQEQNEPTSLEPSLAAACCRLAALSGDQKMFKRYLDIFHQRKKDGLAPEMQLRYLSALSAFEVPEVTARVLKTCLNGAIPQDQLRTILSPMLSSATTAPMTWKFFKTNWQTIGPKVGAMGLSRMVEATGALPLNLKDDVAKFFAQHPVPEASRALKQAMEAFARCTCDPSLWR